MVDGDGTTKITTCGFKKQIQSTFGLQVICDITMDELVVDEYDAFAIPGGFVEYHFYDEAYSETFLGVIREAKAKGKIIASICTGALPIGKSGILNGLKGTTYNKRNGIRQKALSEFGVTVVNQPIVEDHNIITSWNPSTAMDVAFRLLEKLTSSANMQNVRNLMGF